MISNKLAVATPSFTLKSATVERMAYLNKEDLPPINLLCSGSGLLRQHSRIASTFCTLCPDPEAPPRNPTVFARTSRTS